MYTASLPTLRWRPHDLIFFLSPLVAGEKATASKPTLAGPWPGHGTAALRWLGNGRDKYETPPRQKCFDNSSKSKLVYLLKPSRAPDGRAGAGEVAEDTIMTGGCC